MSARSHHPRPPGADIGHVHVLSGRGEELAAAVRHAGPIHAHLHHLRRAVAAATSAAAACKCAASQDHQCERDYKPLRRDKLLLPSGGLLRNDRGGPESLAHPAVTLCPFDYPTSAREIFFQDRGGPGRARGYSPSLLRACLPPSRSIPALHPLPAPLKARHRWSPWLLGIPARDCRRDGVSLRCFSSHPSFCCSLQSCIALKHCPGVVLGIASKESFRIHMDHPGLTC